jgi:hypothetical protein
MDIAAKTKKLAPTIKNYFLSKKKSDWLLIGVQL